MDVSSVMKKEVVSISEDATLEDAIRLLAARRVGLLPVVNAENSLVGILTLHDIIQLALPTFLEMLEDTDFVHDFGALENRKIPPEQRNKLISEFMSPPTSCASTCGLLRAEALMRQHDLRDLPVVDEEAHLVGLASWVDVGVAFLESWSRPPGPTHI
ncbi:MAG: CBS domain-containing protein [Anaerolineales bacterium]